MMMANQRNEQGGLICNVPPETKQTSCYKNLKNIKGVGVDITLDEEYFKEYTKCAKDPIYFIEKYVKIVTIDHGLQPTKLRKYQKKIIKSFMKERFIICKMPRQSGKTTTFSLCFLWYMLFHPDKSLAICANRKSLAVEILSKIKNSYEYLPWFLQQGAVTWNKTSIVLENGSSCIADATTGNSIRGGTYNVILLDEYAHIPDNIADYFLESVYPVISSGKKSKIIMVSTPKGLNHFYKVWKESEEGRNKYKRIEISWRDVPGRDEKWKIETIANTSERLFNQEMECLFLGSSNTLINSAKLNNLTFTEPIKTMAVPYTNRDMLNIYEDVEKGKLYMATVDISEGLGQDYTAIHVFDVSEIPYKQVATFNTNEISEMFISNVIYAIGKYYNDAFVLIENNLGRDVADDLELYLEYPNVIIVGARKDIGQVAGSSRNARAGVRMSASVKRKGCLRLKTLIEEDKLLVCDYKTIDELTNFISKGKSWQADGNKHDDNVMCLVLFAWLSTQDYFKDLSQNDIKEKLIAEKNKDLDINKYPLFSSNERDDYVYDGGYLWQTTENDFF